MVFVDIVTQIHDMDAGRSHIIDMQELAHRRAATPDYNFARVSFDRLVEPPQ